jgi:hypothetical protein
MLVPLIELKLVEKLSPPPDSAAHRKKLHRHGIVSAASRPYFARHAEFRALTLLPETLCDHAM